MRILVVKLADLGDLLLSEPAIRSLRQGFPDAQIDVLTTPHAAELLRHLDPECTPMAFSKAAFDRIGASAIKSLVEGFRLASRLRAGRYDRVAILHHLTTPLGTVKFRALAASTGASVIAGLDNGRGGFLTHPVRDHGFGYKHESEYMLDVARAAGGTSTPSSPAFRLDPNETLPFGLPAAYVVCAPRAGPYSRAREWPLDNYVSLGSLLIKAGWPLVVVGGDDARDAGRALEACCDPRSVINLTGGTSFNQTARVLAYADAVIGNDSFPIHLASAVGTPAIAIFGPSNAKAWAPCSNGSNVLSAELPCAPCLYTGYQLGRPEGCPARTCLSQISASLVFERTLELLDA